MEVRRIVTAIRERNRWLDRQERLLHELAGLSGFERSFREEELRRVQDQIEYYTRLTRDMKIRMRPSHISQILARI